MKPDNIIRRIQWFPTLLILWNIIDIVVHVALNLAEPWRITGNIVCIIAALVIVFDVAKRYEWQILGGTAVVVIVLNVIHSILHGWLAPSFIFIGVSLILLLLWAQNLYREAHGEGENPAYLRWWAALGGTVAGVALVGLAGPQAELVIGPLAQLHNGELVAADYWRDEPVILSAGLGFDNIIGLPEVNAETVREAGGSWYGSVTCTSGEEPVDADHTSAAASDLVALLYKGFSKYDDGLPIVFSWPVASETVDLTDFQFTLNTGEVVFPNSIGMWPNWELSERNTVVAFGDFGNRGLSSEADAVFPVWLDIVEDDTPLLLIGPGGEEFNAVGLSWETDSTPYESGPKLVGAKLNFVGDEALGEGGVNIAQAIGMIPNDEFSLYDEGDFRIRILTTGF